MGYRKGKDCGRCVMLGRLALGLTQGEVMHLLRRRADMTLLELEVELDRKGVRTSASRLSGYERNGTRRRDVVDALASIYGVPAMVLSEKCLVELG